MSIDLTAEYVIHCTHGLGYLSNVRQRQTVLRRLARRATRAETQKLLADIAATKVALAEAEQEYLGHIGDCTACRPRPDAPPRPKRTPKATPEREACPRCGRDDVNLERRHWDRRGKLCTPKVELGQLPPVEFPGKRKAPPARTPSENARPRYATGKCHDCGDPVTGERWYCAHCAMLRQTRRTR